MEKVVLVIIYNHRYDKNINLIQELYKKRFSKIFHVVPFYDGNVDNVLPVYENSHYFSGYIAQAYNQLKCRNLTFVHYLFIADDMLLNPLIDEYNYSNFFVLKSTSSYISNLVDMTQIRFTDWARCQDAFFYNPTISGVEIGSILPSIEEASRIFERYNIGWSRFEQNFYDFDYYKFPNEIIYERVKNYILNFNRKGFRYPLVGGYSDLLVVSHSSIEKFILYCGVFAAVNLFVEVAIPTALVLSSNEIVTGTDSQLKSGAIWPKHDFLATYTYMHDELKDYMMTMNNSLSLLYDKFPDNYLFLHPIKLSSWKFSS